MNSEEVKTELIVILGPTASGKTELAVNLAYQLNGEIISADSRQVYKKMDVGTGKDLAEYIKNDKNIPYHLIDICEAGEKYNVARFQNDFHAVFEQVKSRNGFSILCGGTGLYIQAAISDLWKTQIPVNEDFREESESLETEVILEKYAHFLENYHFSSRKRLVRMVEICEYLEKNPEFSKGEHKAIDYTIFGLNPALELRRERISKRLKDRFEGQGMVAEVQNLLNDGVSAETLEYYGLEYKYISYFLKNDMTFDQMFSKLETEIHRFAKRQMTFFRSMESKGFKINWIPDSLSKEEKLQYILNKI
ncbi:tRNA (adenosine(37)-N6)-dimethylallyltransferase MiaA [Lacihabitans sp. CCS-44]|uniref:tRNA (adenosine(37)-N6)-dimethylallyltransferase MiaA n=1 Tax=Lacihabitans sp. CCS-44 TaxID=2487331 RepID=UPI0020CFAB54|nr:tRNA (adenosine(37)-N6)-dimethylallyltransferase MiaA [Lacihabitans sp. CCS-44]MCP9756275.1 tRNA (adenosine(37)-N6)-dimethylallyltransferase MiaA [Lacihabitans sp. CCS-44]